MKIIKILFVLLITVSTYAQTDAETIRTIYSSSLTNGKSYAWLDHLSNEIGGRLSGSENAEKSCCLYQSRTG